MMTGNLQQCCRVLSPRRCFVLRGAALLLHILACTPFCLGCWQQHQLGHSLAAFCWLASAFGCPEQPCTAAHG